MLIRELKERHVAEAAHMVAKDYRPANGQAGQFLTLRLFIQTMDNR